MAKKKAKKVIKKKNPLRTVSEIMGSAGLDEMVEQYLATGLWSSTDYDGKPLDDTYSTSDISDEFYEESKKDCQEFWDKTHDLYEEDELDFGTIGHDFWLTRNHHGAGFWDGDYEKGDELTKIAQEFGEVDLNEHIVTDEDEITKSNPNKEIDEILVRDVYLTLNNESEFYKNYLVPLYKSAEKFYKKGQYNSKNFINALQKGINEYTLHGPVHFSYNRKFAAIIPKHEREAVAKMFEEYLLGELELGNGWLASNPRDDFKPITSPTNNFHGFMLSDVEMELIGYWLEENQLDKCWMLKGTIAKNKKTYKNLIENKIAILNPKLTDWAGKDVCIGLTSFGKDLLRKKSNPRPRKFKDVFVIVGRSSYGKEDIDEFETLSEARKMLIEYRMAMPTYSLTIVKRKEALEEKKSNPIDHDKIMYKRALDLMENLDRKAISYSSLEKGFFDAWDAKNKRKILFYINELAKLVDEVSDMPERKFNPTAQEHKATYKKLYLEAFEEAKKGEEKEAIELAYHSNSESELRMILEDNILRPKAVNFISYKLSMLIDSKKR